MFALQCRTFAAARDRLAKALAQVPAVPQTRWQGKPVGADPAARCYELRDVALSVPLNGVENLEHWRADCRPNVPWADDHFAERVGGEPLNPGVQWANWPWASSADTFRAGGVFNHTYMERLWPKRARVPDGAPDRRGIDRPYGDLADLVKLLARDPYTRQAWVPLFFPEDTGWGDGGRKPCTLGYQFFRRGSDFHVFYPLRSCDFVRHWADDCYLAVRLLLWVLGELRRADPGEWAAVRPGDYSMWLTSLHVFENDRRKL